MKAEKDFEWNTWKWISTRVGSIMGCTLLVYMYKASALTLNFDSQYIIDKEW